MKYCPKCKVNVHHELKNCPLCGSYLDEKDNNDKCEIYREMDEKIKYPILHEQPSNFFESKFNIILLVATLLCVALNVIINPESHWSSYVAMGFVFAVGVVMLPINYKTKLQKQIRVDILLCTAIAIAMEFAVLNGQFNFFCVEFVIPWLYVVAIVFVDFLIIFTNNTRRGLFSTLLYCTVFALLPQIIMWIAGWREWYEAKTLINFVIFFASLINLAVMFVVYSKQMKEDMERNLNV